MKDTIIIGCGPAGISTALYLRKLNHDVLVIGKDTGNLTKYDIIDNFYGHDSIPGDQLIQKGIEQAINLGIDYVKDFVISIEKQNNSFIIKTASSIYESKSVVITTGKQRIPLKVKGFTNFKGHGIHLCASCDGFFYKNKSIAVIGAGAYMEKELEILENFTSNITIFTNGKPYTSSKYNVIEDPIKSFIGENRLSKILTIDNEYEVKGAFVAIGHPQANELALKLGILIESNNIVVNKQMETNIPGIFAGGDAIGGKLQIAKAVYDGLKISDGVHKYLKRLLTQ